MPFLLAGLAAGAIAVAGLVTGRDLIEETGDQVHKNSNNIVALVVAGAALYWVINASKKRGR